MYATVLFIPLLTLEAKELSNYSKLGEFNFLLLMIIGGVCGLSIGYITVLQVQVSLNSSINNKFYYLGY